MSDGTLLEDGRLRFGYVRGDEGARPVRELEEGWRIEFQQDEGRWLVDPIRAHDTPAIAVIEVRPT